MTFARASFIGICLHPQVYHGKQFADAWPESPPNLASGPLEEHAKYMTERFQGKDRGGVEIYADSFTGMRRPFFKRTGYPTL